MTIEIEGLPEGTELLKIIIIPSLDEYAPMQQSIAYIRKIQHCRADDEPKLSLSVDECKAITAYLFKSDIDVSIFHKLSTFLKDNK